MDVQEAMVTALKRALTSITASGVTTVIGFAALILMRFKIGPDMGVVMAKAILLSMISVLVFLPVMALICYKLIDKTQHRPLMPSFQWFSRFVPKLRVPAVCIFLLLIAPSFLAQNSNDFYFGASEIIGSTTEAYAERAEIESVFGKSNQMVLMVPAATLPWRRC